MRVDGEVGQELIVFQGVNQLGQLSLGQHKFQILLLVNVTILGSPTMNFVIGPNAVDLRLRVYSDDRMLVQLNQVCFDWIYFIIDGDITPR